MALHIRPQSGFEAAARAHSGRLTCEWCRHSNLFDPCGYGGISSAKAGTTSLETVPAVLVEDMRKEERVGGLVGMTAKRRSAIDGSAVNARLVESA